MILMPMASAILSCASIGPVVLRGEAQPDPRSVVSISLRGVELRGGDEGAPVWLIGWERVKALTGEHEVRHAEFAQIADDAWRARERLLRGDVELASPLLERLDAAMKLESGPTALLAACGMARAHLDRGDRARAVEPMLRAWSLVSRGQPIDPPLAAATGFDPSSALMPDLAPVFDASDGVSALAGAALIEAFDESDPARPLALAYAWAMGGGASAHKLDAASHAHADVALVMLLVRAAHAESPTDRAEARETLMNTASSQIGTWREAWARAAIGSSLLLDADAAERERGVLEVLQVPARFEDSLPATAGVLLRRAAREMAARGDDDAAANLESQARDALSRPPTARAPAEPPAPSSIPAILDPSSSNPGGPPQP